MGNTVGIECSLNRVHVTCILINQNGKKKKKIPSMVGYSNHVVISLSGDMPDDKEKLDLKDNKGIPIFAKCTEEKVKYDTNGNHIDDYSKLKRNMLAYILATQHIMGKEIQLLVLRENVEKSEFIKISLAELGKHTKCQNSLEEKILIFSNFLKAQFGIIEDAKEVTSGDDNTSHNHGKNPLYSQNNGEIAQFYFLTVHVKNVEEAILACPEEIIKRMTINLTGAKANQIKKKLANLREITNVHLYKEIICINSCIRFLKWAYPKSLYDFVMSEGGNVVEKYSNRENGKGGKQHIGGSTRECSLIEHSLDAKESIAICPYLIVQMKRGISYHLVDKQNNIHRIGSCFIGYKTIQGLVLLITGKLLSLEKICKLSLNGKTHTFDMTVGDIYGKSYGNAGLSSDLTASFFGTAQHIDNVKGLFSAPDGMASSAESGSVESGIDESKSGESKIDESRSGESEIDESRSGESEIDESRSSESVSSENVRGGSLRDHCTLGEGGNSDPVNPSVGNQQMCAKLCENRKRRKVGSWPFTLPVDASYDKQRCQIDGKKTFFNEKKAREKAKIKERKLLFRNLSDTELEKCTKESINRIRSDFRRGTAFPKYVSHMQECKRKKVYSALDNTFLLKKLPDPSKKKKYMEKKNYEQIREKTAVKFCAGINSFQRGTCVHNKEAEMLGNIENDTLGRESDDISTSTVGQMNSNNDRVHKKRVLKFNSKESDLSKSLLSMVIYNAAQQAYIHSHMYNVKHVIFSGLLLDNPACIGLLKNLIKFMYHNTQKLYFIRFSSHVSSLGSALQAHSWDSLHERYEKG
ncbi:pantothenate kinase, putative [Plasmodium ovale curtisi]|uniref:Pantothenate kinase, putative n=1 Tax=Plasmodium ovale curtisi TaxID=864141 RepID=A0A1A8W2I8_PLAOA|nr:pantothenate kinase, putative [Plasmodium ovale curtisi]